jgi:hypothetical protein
MILETFLLYKKRDFIWVKEFLFVLTTRIVESIAPGTPITIKYLFTYSKFEKKFYSSSAKKTSGI